jgi:hypothetical protein
VPHLRRVTPQARGGERIPRTRRPLPSGGDDRPTWADAAETAQGSRSRPPTPRFQAPVCLLHAGQVRPFLDCARSSLREHRRRRINPYNTPARSLSNRDRNAAVPNCKLDQWPVSITGKPGIERDVSWDASGPVAVSVRPGVVPARHSSTNLRVNKATFGCASVRQ